MLKHLDQRRRDDEGFTLIELMVVVLILGILMAIAIPTFLSTTKSANGVAAEANATNAATSEVSYYSTNSTFLSSSAGSTLDPAIPWVSTSGTTAASAGQVVVDDTTAWGTAATNADTATTTGMKIFVLESLAKDSECYIVLDDQAATTPVVAYAATTAGTGCPAVSGITSDPTAAGVATAGKLNAAGGAASNKNGTATISTTFNWYNSF